MTGLLAFVILTAAGLPLSARVLGLRAETLPLAALLGAGFTAAAAAVEVGIGGSPLALNSIALVSGFVVPLVIPGRRLGVTGGSTSRAAELGLLVIPALVLIWALVPLARTRIGYDARSIWLLHARLLYGGHHAYLDHASAFPFSHPDYPPLVSGSVAFDWLLRGSIAYRDGQVVIGLLTAAGTLLAATAVARAATASPRLRMLAAAIVVVLAYGVWGTYATNGYVDPLLTSLVLAALVYGVLLPGRDVAASPESATLVLVVVVLASLAKNEGLAYGLVVLAVLVALEVTRRRALRPLLVRVAIAVAAMAVWPVVGRARGITSNLTQGGSGDRAHRLHRTLDALGHGVEAAGFGFLGLLIVALCVRSLRAQAVAFLVAVGLTGVVLVATYTFGPDPIDQWLANSIDRTDMLLRLAGLVSALLAAAVAMRKIKHRESHASR